MPHLTDVEGIMVQDFHKECNSWRRQLVIVSQQQRQEADRNVLEFPRPEVTKSKCQRQQYVHVSMQKVTL